MLFHIFPLVLLCAIAVVVGGAVDREGSLVLWRAIDRVARTDSEQYLAQLYPHIPASQRPHVGVVPSNIRGLIQGAEPGGRLTLAFPPRGTALLLTKVVPEGRIVTAPHFVASSASVANANTRTVRGIGVVHDDDGVHWFRTVPFDPPPTIPSTAIGEGHMRPHSADGTLFPPRRISLPLPQGGIYSSKDKVKLAHLSVVPLSHPPNDPATVYPRELLAEVLAGPKEGESVGGGMGWEKLVQWGEEPNWTKKERRAMGKKSQEQPMTSGTSSPKKWIKALRKSLSRSKSSTGSSSGEGEGSSRRLREPSSSV